MYTEALTTPHQLKSSGEPPRLLTDHIDQGAIASDLYAIRIERPELYEEAVIDAADFVTDAVAKALWFPESDRPGGRDDYREYGLPNPLTLDIMKERQFANCIGYTVAASEQLEPLGIRHWISFINGHATLVLPLPRSNRLRLQDPLAPELNQDLNPVIVRGSKEKAESDLRKYGRAALQVNTLLIAQNGDAETVRLLERVPWLRRKRPDELPVSDERFIYDMPGYIAMSEKKYRREYQKSFKVIMNLFESGHGRKVLADYSEFRCDWEAGNYHSAAGCLKSMSGAFPEVDARESHNEIKQLVRLLSSEGEVLLASEVIEHYFSSFVISNDSRFMESKADCLRILAGQSRDPGAADMARTLYERALRSPNAFKRRLEGKIGKTAALCSNLQQTAPAR